MKALKSHRAQETTWVDLTLDEKLASLVGDDLASVSKARAVVARLDDETASRLDRLTEFKIKPPAPRRPVRTALDRPVRPADNPVTPAT
jgi:hypothetical protein